MPKDTHATKLRRRSLKPRSDIRAGRRGKQSSGTVSEIESTVHDAEAEHALPGDLQSSRKRGAPPGGNAIRGGWLIRPHRTNPWHQLKEIWRSRSVFAYLLRHTILTAYQRTILGLLWLFIRPFVIVVASTFVFREMLGVRTGDVPYPVFVLCGLFGWLLFQRGLAWTTRGMYKIRRLLRQFYFPRLLGFVASYGPAWIESGIVLICFLLSVLFYSVYFNTHAVVFGWRLLLIGPIILWIMLAVSAISLFTSVLHMYAKDAWFILRYSFIVMMLATPVFYPVSSLPDNLQDLMLYNPLSAIFVSLRAVFFGTDWAPQWSLFISLGVIGFMNIIGTWFFLRWEASALDDTV